MDLHQRVIEGGGWSTAEQITELVGCDKALLKKWKKDQLIFSVRYDGTEYFPCYALDPGADHRPAEALSEVLAIFRDRKNDWGIAIWFASLNSYLGGRRPQDLMTEQPRRIIAAAEAEAAGITHG